MSTTTSKGTALITGASAGIGAVYADRLARRGYDLILVARNKTRLAVLAQRLRRSTGRAVETVAADLNDKADLARIEAILRANARISLLVNNAGVAATAPLLNADVEKMDEMIRLNVSALTRLTYAAVPGFAARHETLHHTRPGRRAHPPRPQGSSGKRKTVVVGFRPRAHRRPAKRGGPHPGGPPARHAERLGSPRGKAGSPAPRRYRDVAGR